MLNKLKALIQWFMELELQEHRHWCHLWTSDWLYNNCEHRTACWFCKGLFCSQVERKNCPECEVARCQSDDRPPVADEQERNNK